MLVVAGVVVVGAVGQIFTPAGRHGAAFKVYVAVDVYEVLVTVVVYTVLVL